MFRVSNYGNKRSASRSESVPPKKAQPGYYQAKVTEVEEPEEYAKGDALNIRYELTDPKTGDSVLFEERFFTSEANPRWEEINTVMDTLGVGEDTEDFVGCEFQVELRYEVKQGKKYLNIVNYIFPDGEEEGDTDAPSA